MLNRAPALLLAFAAENLEKCLARAREKIWASLFDKSTSVWVWLTIIPRAQMGSESIAHEAERNNCFSKIQWKIQLVKNIDETKKL